SRRRLRSPRPCLIRTSRSSTGRASPSCNGSASSAPERLTTTSRSFGSERTARGRSRSSAEPPTASNTVLLAEKPACREGAFEDCLLGRPGREAVAGLLHGQAQRSELRRQAVDRDAAERDDKEVRLELDLE